jgi:hypothetical protein
LLNFWLLRNFEPAAAAEKKREEEEEEEDDEEESIRELRKEMLASKARVGTDKQFESNICDIS